MILFVMFNLKLVDKIFSVSSIYSATHDCWYNYLTDEFPEFSVVITEEDISFERVRNIREKQAEGILHYEYPDKYLEITAIQRKITETMFNCNVLLFHGSVIAVDGNAYLFTAKSGTGKSTHTRLWREVFGDRAVMVNDDKPFLQITESGVIAWGSPWNGKHRLGSNIGVPLKAICILERSAENQIQPITAAQALPMLFQQSQRPRNPANMAKYLELVDKLANCVAFYRMGCNMNPEAAKVSYEAMSGERKEDL